MLARTVFHNISIGTCKQEIFPIFIIAYGVYITRLLNCLKEEEMTNIQCFISKSNTPLQETNYLQGICSKHLLEYLIIIKSFGS